MKGIGYSFILLFSFLLFTNCAISLYDHGKSFLNDEQYDEAIKIFLVELKANPENANIWRDLGIAYYKNGMPDKALAALEKSHQLDSGDGSTIFYLGAIYEDRSDYQRAIDYFSQYIRVGRLKKIRGKLERRLESLTRKKMTAEIEHAVKNEAQINPDSIPENTIAVLHFQNLSGKEQWNPLQKGLAEVLSYDLSKVKSLLVLERLRFQVLLNELALADSGIVDPETAPRVGRLLSAHTLINGSFIELDSAGNAIRIDAGFIKTKTGARESSQEVTGQPADFFRLEKMLVFNILDQMGIILTDEERKDIEVIPTKDFSAFLAFSLGLELEDQNRFDAARAQFETAFSLDPGFEMARNKAEAVSRMQEIPDELGSLQSVIDEDLKTVVKPTKARLGASGSQINAGIVPGQDERDAFQEATGTEGFGGVPVEVEVVIPD